MRTPNPPRVILDGLSNDQMRKVIRIALKVVADLARERPWDAFGHIELADLTLEEKLGLGSLLDSQQAATIVSIRHLAEQK